MKAISTGNVYRIYDDTLKTYDQLPPEPFIVRFSNIGGFFLERYSDIEINENKIYGVHPEKVKKVMDSFEQYNRSLGVILSGDKGIGKSLFAKLLASKAMERGLPLIIVDRYIGGIASYLESIEQEVIVLFDEFDKTFGEVRSMDGEASPQSTMLTLSDGVSPGKKLFVITCNELCRLNDYLINRPGRFHYHFRFGYPSADEVREYLMDKLPKDKHPEINEVVSFSRKVNLNYDCLRAIAFEIRNGMKFKDAIQDLNIVNVERESYQVSLCYDNGTVLTARNVRLNLFDEDDVCVDFYDRRGTCIAFASFSTVDCIYDPNLLTNVVYPDQINIEYYDDSENPEITQFKNEKLKYMKITRVEMKNLHYAV